jgi:hypothetical protein
LDSRQQKRVAPCSEEAATFVVADRLRDMKPESPFLIVVFLIFGALILLLTRWQLRRGREMLESWCGRAGYDLVSAHHRLLFRGPYFWASKGQMVYKISARDRGGRVHSGYARCGGYWLGVFTEKVDVRWDA